MPRRTKKDVKALAELYDNRDELDDVHRFEDAPDAKFPLPEIEIGPRLDRLIEHGWVEVDMESGDAWLSYGGYALARTASTSPELLEDLSLRDFIKKAGAKNGLKMR